MRLDPRAVTAALTFALLVTACGKSGPPASEFPALGEPAKVKLLEPGAADRTAVRWKAVKGATGGVHLDLDTQIQIDAGGQSMPMTMKMQMDMLSEVREVSAEGVATLDNEIVDADLQMPGMPGGGDASSMVKDMMRGLRMSLKLDARGRASDVEVTGGGAFAKQLADQLGQSLENSTIPFPEEPVGVGAKWQALTRVEANQMQMRVVVEYELVSLSGAKGEVKMTITQYADAQTMKINGVDAKLEKLKSAGTGSLKFDLARPTVVTGEMDLKMDASMEVMGTSADMRMVMHMTFAPKEGLVSTQPAGGADEVAPTEGAPEHEPGEAAPTEAAPEYEPGEAAPEHEPGEGAPEPEPTEVAP